MGSLHPQGVELGEEDENATDRNPGVGFTDASGRAGALGAEVIPFSTDAMSAVASNQVDGDSIESVTAAPSRSQSSESPSSIPSKRPAEDFPAGTDRESTPEHEGVVGHTDVHSDRQPAAMSPWKKQKRMDDFQGGYRPQIAGLMHSKAAQLRMYRWDGQVGQRVVQGHAFWWLGDKNKHARVDAAGEKKFFIEIQVKGVSGSEPQLLRECGVHPCHVWAAIDPELATFLDDESSKEPIWEKGNEHIPRSKSQPNVSQGRPEDNARPLPLPIDVDSPSPSHSDKAEDSHKDRDNDTEDSDALSTAATGYTTDEEIEPTAQTAPSDGDVLPPQALSAFSDGRKSPVEGAPTRDEILSKHLTSGEHVFLDRMRKSTIFIVRVVAFKSVAKCNQFNGPADRKATLLGEAGWIAPPLQERILALKHERSLQGVQHAAWAEENEANYKGLPRGLVNRTRPFEWDLDQSSLDGVETRGEPAPQLNQVSDPTLEDVYWLVWQMMCGRQFTGFRPGVGFGITEAVPPEQDAKNVASSPFSSPSEESLYHDYNFRI